MDLGIVSLIPIAICLSLILLTKNAFVSIVCALVSGSIIVFAYSGETFTAINSVVGVATDPYQFKIIGFVVLTGALVSAMQCSGGLNGAINILKRLQKRSTSKVAGQLLVMLIGILMFMDGTSSMALTAVVGKPVFAQLKLPKEKLALVVNSTAAPIAWIIPFGGAAAMVAGALTESGVDASISFTQVFMAIPFQFYTILLLVFLAITIITGVEIGPIKHCKYEEQQVQQEQTTNSNILYMLIPLLTLVAMIFIMLFYTGDGNLMSGDGATAVFTAGSVSLFVTAVFYRVVKLGTMDVIMSWFFKGMRNMVEIMVLLLVAFAFGSVINQIGTAAYLVQVTQFLPPQILPFAILILASVIAFCTGTSSGTIAIIIPLVMPIVMATGSSIPLAVGAVVSGAVFGDQNSVISDSVLMTCSMTGAKPLDHVRTQLPYTLIVLGVSSVLYLICGFIV